MGLFSDLSGIGKSGPGWSRSRYAGDFKVVEVPDKKGRLRKKAVYTGTWTVMRDLTVARRILWGCLGLTVLDGIAYGRALLLTHFSSGKFLVMIPLLAGLFPLFYLCMGATALPYGGKPMRRDQYMHSFIRMSRSAVAVAAFALTGMLATLVYRIALGDWLFLPEDKLFLGLYLAAVAASVLIVILLRRVDLMERENGAYERDV